MNDFNKSALYSFLLLVSIPFLYGAFCKSVTSFFYAFDNVSIPVFMGIYSLFWIRFSRCIKDSEKKISRYNDEVKAFQKIHNRSGYEYAGGEDKLNKLKIELSESKINLEHINYGLQFALVFWAIIKIIEFALHVYSQL